MPRFICSVCGDTFEVPPSALEKYPGWKPKYCRRHSPAKARRSAKPSSKPSRSNSSSREENLPLAEVLAKYTDGPSTGVFTDGGAHPNPGPGGWGMVWVEDGEVRA